ncbi:hypothetical protein HOP38_02710 [Vibrio mediterranei]|uniref:hypothetical protein n=1 Tax=Vibrio mediterranei TaxID=689 RepID=UPI00179CE173|nr:hypothetical protein [Vibrio mediterranei]NUW71422.1 hypothetical protein [Vibrio mediterranei]
MLVPVRDIAQNGLQLDIPDFDLPANALSDGDNVYVKDGTIRSIEGESYYFSIANAVSVHNWALGDGDKTIVITKEAVNNKFYVYESPTRNTEVTPAAGVLAADWHVTQHGEFAIFSADGMAPLYLGPTDSELKPLPGWDAITDSGQAGGNKIDAKAGLIISYQNHLVAFRVQLGQNAASQNVLWSAPLAIDTIATDWNYGAADSTSGLDIAPAELGEVITAKQIGRSVLIYHTHGLSKMAYMGAPQIYKISPIDNDRGILNSNALASMKNVHFCVDTDKIYAHDGQRALYIADGKIQRWFSERVGDPELVQVVTIIERDEVLFLFAEVGSSSLTHALIYNQRANAWTKRRLPSKWDKQGAELAATVIGAARIKILPNNAVTYANIGTTHEEETRSYSDLARTTVEDSIVFLTSTGDIFRANYGGAYRSDSNLTPYIIQSAIDLESLYQSSKPIKSIKALYPQIKGIGELIITVGGHNSTQEGVSWGRQQTFVIGRDKKVDLRGSWRYLSVKIEQPQSGYFWISGWDIDVILKGGR